MATLFTSVQAVLWSSLPNVVGFGLAAVLCYVVGSRIAERSFNKWDTILKLRLKPTNPQSFGEAGDLVGMLERNLFIYAVLIQQFGLITTVIILKAFFAWIDWQAPSGRTRDLVMVRVPPPPSAEAAAEKWRHYSLYCGGSLISIGIGVVFGEFARFVAFVMKGWLKV